MSEDTVVTTEVANNEAVDNQDTISNSDHNYEQEGQKVVEAKRYKVKINNEDLEVDEAELIRGYQTRKAADEKFREAANARKQSEELIRLLRDEDSVFDVLQKLGLDPRNISERYLIKQLEEDVMSPEEKETRDMKRKLAEYENQKKQSEKAKEDEERLALINKYTNDYSAQVIDALENNGLPKTPHTVKRMAYYMHQSLQRGYDLKASDVVHLVREDYQEDQKALYGSLDGDKLVEILGKDITDKIRKHGLSRRKQLSNTKKAQVTSKSKDSKGGKMTMQEWRDDLAKKYK